MSGHKRLISLFGAAVLAASSLAVGLLPAAQAAAADAPLTWQRQAVAASGNNGWYSSLALDSAGRPHVAYKATGGNVINYAWYDEATGKWHGYNSTTPNTVYSGSTTSAPSLAFDNAGVPHIAFGTSGAMRFATWNGANWTVSPVQMVTGHFVGLFPSLKFDSQGRAHVSYIDCAVGGWRDCTSGGSLMYATSTGGPWTITTVDPAVTGVSMDGYTSLALTTTDQPRIAYFNELSGGQIRYASYDGTSWAVTQPPLAGGPYSRNLSLALFGDQPRIAYDGGTYGSQLHYAKFADGAWSDSGTIATISTTGVASQSALAVDSADRPHIVYRASLSGKARIGHAWYDETTGKWQFAVVPAVPSVEIVSDLGATMTADWYPSIALDSQDRPRVTYFMQASGVDGPVVYAHLSTAPVATDDTVTVNEDTAVEIDVAANDTTGYGFSGNLTVSRIVTPPTHGTASVLNGKVSYQGAQDYNGTDSLVYEVCDANSTGLWPIASPTDPAEILCSTATVNITVLPVNDPPTAMASPASATVQYGDPMAAPITVTGADVDNEDASLTFSATGLPAGVTLTDNLDGTATISGTPTAPAATYQAKVTVTDPDGATGTVTVPITVTAESVVVRPAQDNPHAVATTGTAPAMTFTARITEAADGTYDVPGHLGDATFTFKLDPVGGGQGASCIGTVTRSVPATATSPAFVDVTCTFGEGLPLDVYALSVTVSGGYYDGVGYSGLTVYNPALGGTYGSGTLANGAEFYFTAKYLKSRQVQGKMLVILTDESGNQSVLKGNVMSTMAITGTTVKITGKATLDSVGNYKYVLTAIAGGQDVGQFGIAVTSPTGAIVPGMTFDPLPISTGVISVG